MACCNEVQSQTVDQDPVGDRARLDHAFQQQQIRVLEACFNERGILDMEKVTTNMWRHKGNPDLTQAIIELLSKNSDERSVFDGVEFYLPQLAHMVIHLDEDFPLKALQAFVLSVVQQSLHFALQLHWILIAMMQDYSPELPDGLPNPEYDFIFYMRTVVLLQTTDRCVMSGSPRRAQLENLFRMGAVTDTEMRELEIADRRFNAMAMLEALGENDFGWLEGPGEISGFLYCKRWMRKSKVAAHQWKSRFIKVHHGMLFVFRGREDGHLKRAMPLEDVTIEEGGSRHEFYFEIKSYYGNMKFRASSQEDYDRWINGLKALREKAPRPFFEKESEQAISKVQESKWLFFKSERKLVKRMCEIVDDLYDLPIPDRKEKFEEELMDLELPESGYVPMCQSTDKWCSILRITPNENKCFKSKARVPGLITFELDEHHDDVATHLFKVFTTAYEDGRFGHSRTSRSISFDMHMRQSSEMKEEETPTKSGGITGMARRLFSTSRKESVQGDQPSPVPEDEVREGSMPRISQRSMWRSSSKLKRRSSKLANSHFRWPTSALREKIASKAEGLSSRGGSAELDVDGKSETSIKVSTNTLGENWSERVERLRNTSQFGGRPGWRISQIIAKSNDDVRQEVFIMQLFQFYKNIFDAEGLPLWLQPYRILSTSNSTGLIEVVTDTQSFDGLKKMDNYPGSMLAHFEASYGPQSSETFKEAQKNYIESLAAYSIVCYLLGIKDRHNGNIMLDVSGHVIHIDYGFVFGSAPGNQFSMERGPFKLTVEMVDVMGGLNSPGYNRFVELCTIALKAARDHSEVVVTMLEIMMYKSKLPFAEHGRSVVEKFRSRLLKERVPDNRLQAAVEQQLVRKSYNHMGANLYDKFQVMSNGIAK